MPENAAFPPGLRFEGVTISLDGTRLIALDCNVDPGEVLTVMGPSGSGKSTLLAAITGTLPPAFRLAGRIRLDGQDLAGLPTEARQVGILFQDEYLFPHLSVGANLAFGLKPALKGRAARRARVEAAFSVPAVAGRLADLRQLRHSFDTYDEVGQRRTIDGDVVHRVEKRA